MQFTLRVPEGMRGRNRHWQVLVALFALLIGMVSVVGATRAAGNTYYIATNGSDSNPGSQSQPFQTIQKCASVATAGSTCVIRAGTYHETVTPANSGTASAPITFQAYNGEQVTINGADKVTGSWTNDSGNIYHTTVQTNPNLLANQVFVDGVMINEARWPNMGLDQMRPVRSIAESGTTTSTIYDSHLTQPTGFWIGAIVHFWGHEGYYSQTATVTASAPGYVTFSGVTGCPWMCTTEFSKYYLSGVRGALDSPGEWYYDNSSHQLYVWTPTSDNPSGHTVELKQRNYAFDLSGKSYVQVKGVHLFADTILSDMNSSNLLIDGIVARYLSHLHFLDNPDNSFFGFGSAHGGDTGIILHGSNNTLQNSDIGISAGTGVSVSGNGHIVTNNLIHETDYMGFGTASIGVSGNNIQITHNTVYESAYNGINVDGTNQYNTISYNDLFNSSMLNRDSGSIYLCCDDATTPHTATGTVLDHNLVHDSQLVNVNTTSDYNAVGIYPDNGTNGLTIHHNVLWNNVDEAFHVNPVNGYSKNNLYYNNTVGLGQQLSLGDCCGPNYSGSQFINNIFSQPLPSSMPNATLSNNILPGTDPKFVDPVHNDLHLQAGSPAIDAGKVLPPYTDGYVGSAPDIGAYEYGSSGWTAGSTLDKGVEPIPSILDDSRSDGKITFNWGSVKGATGYKVHYGTTSESYDHTLDVGNTLSTTLTGLTNGIPYYFAVSAYSSGSETPNSSERWDVPTGGNRSISPLIYASTFDAASSGVTNHKTYVGDFGLGNNASLQYNNVDFGTTGADFLTVDYGSQSDQRSLEVHLDSPTGTLIGTVNEKHTGDNYLAWSMFTAATVRISHTTGVHTVYLVAPSGWGNIASFRFSPVPASYDAYSRIPATGYSQLNGNVAIGCGASCLSQLDGGSWVKYGGVNFGSGATSVNLDIASTGIQTLELHLDSPSGTLIGTQVVQNSGGATNYITQRTVVTGASGTHDLYLVVPGTQTGVANLDWLSFGQASYSTTGNIALNKPATGSSNDDPSDDAPFGDDGNPNTRWSSTYSDAQWYIVDLGSVTHINEYTISWQNGTDQPNSYDFQVSNDGQTWTTVYSSTSGGGTEDVTGLNANGRYVRINGVKRTWQWGYTFYELQIFSQEQGLDRTGWTASASSSNINESPANALDGDPNTRWSSGTSQSGGEWFQVDMKSMKSFNKVTLDSTGSANDYPRGYQVFVSTDGANWGSAVASGTGSSAVTTITFPTQYARYIKIVQTGTGTFYWWSIHEFYVHGAPALNRTGWTASASSSYGNAPPANALDNQIGTRWASGANQANGQWFEVDMHATKSFSALTLDAASSANDYPRGYQVFVSTDGTNWGSAIATGAGSASNPLTVITFSPQSARYIKIVQTGSDPIWWWSIYEFNVYP